jgi:hypothetical protein
VVMLAASARMDSIRRMGGRLLGVRVAQRVGRRRAGQFTSHPMP